MSPTPCQLFAESAVRQQLRVSTLRAPISTNTGWRSHCSAAARFAAAATFKPARDPPTVASFWSRRISARCAERQVFSERDYAIIDVISDHQHSLRRLHDGSALKLSWTFTDVVSRPMSAWSTIIQNFDVRLRNKFGINYSVIYASHVKLILLQRKRSSTACPDSMLINRVVRQSLYCPCSSRAEST